MKIRSQVGMVRIWTNASAVTPARSPVKRLSSREGMEYAWFNNVETKPHWLPQNWEDRDQWQGG
ncbi:Respiratory nitrate reductase 2 beta chain [Klebsiella pneumoniae]|nr:Respiratory nitrate reductase 2 beta chain [Klebsiella pneumoniae]